MKTVRCAIYTRKSSDDGLEQDFNSLHAQREACAAYILSQASEGWTALPERYDDGGISGGTLERPALQRLLADVADGRIDTVVFYKVDRLSRSLFDFARLVELFEQADTTFVSVTQAFNTTSSMGRLTLNMLLSFAQFEREVTGERIRDKIAASKAKGMWMGGVAPLGYQPDGRSLAVVAEHAVLVRSIFERYLVLGSVRHLADELARNGTLAPARTLASGRRIGGVPFSRGQLYLLLKNPLYLGEVHHRGQVHLGLQPPLIERGLWERVQAQLADQTQGKRRGRPQSSQALLAGRIVDEKDEPLIPVFSSKGQGGARIRYGYYVSAALHHKGTNEGLRIPGREADALVADRLADACDDPLRLLAELRLEVAADDLRTFCNRAAALASTIRQQDPDTIRRMVTSVRVKAGAVEIHCDVQALAEQLGATLQPNAPDSHLLVSSVRLTRSGRAMRLVGDGGPAPTLDQSLLRLLAHARRYWLELKQGEIDVTRLAKREGVSGSWLTRVLRLAFLSPRLVETILAGKQPATMMAAALMQTDAINMEWNAQQDSLANCKAA